MKLPNGDKAIVADEKLHDYLLNEQHEINPGHAALFRKLLGIERSNFENLKEALLRAAVGEDAVEGKPSPFGTKYEIRFPMTHEGATYTIVSAWIIESGEENPRLVTAYIE